MEIREILDMPRDVFEGFCRSKTQYAYLGAGDALTRVLGKYMMYVDTQDISLAPHFAFDGFWESWITLAMSRLPAGIRSVDIGANHGYFSLILADLCQSPVTAFEPQTELARRLRLSAAVNGFRGLIDVREQVVGAGPGFAKMSFAADFGEIDTGSVYFEEGAQGMPVVSLDEAIPEKLGFVKIDAEGFEPQIWAGMKRHLESRPTILMEFSPVRYEDKEAFLDEIALCYPLRRVDESGSVVPVNKNDVLDSPSFEMLWLETK